MREPLATKLDALEKFPAAVKQTIMEAQTSSELVDVLGTVASVTRQANTQKKLAQEEAIPTAEEGIRTGERISVEVRRAADRSYNTPALLKLFQSNGISLHDLMFANVLNLSWRWTDLKAFAKRRGIDLTIVDHEIPEMGDADGPHVGEVWGDGSPSWTVLQVREDDDS